MLRSKRPSPVDACNDGMEQHSYEKNASDKKDTSPPTMIWKRNGQKIVILIAILLCIGMTCSIMFESFEMKSINTPYVLADKNTSSTGVVEEANQSHNLPTADIMMQSRNSFPNPQEEDKDREEEQNLKQAPPTSQDDVDIKNDIASTQISSVLSKESPTSNSNSQEESVRREEVVEEVKIEGNEDEPKQSELENAVSAEESVENEKAGDEAKSEEDEATDKVEEVLEEAEEVVENEKTEEIVVKETEEVVEKTEEATEETEEVVVVTEKIVEDVVKVDEGKEDKNEQEEQTYEQSPLSTESTSITNTSQEEQRANEENKPAPVSDATSDDDGSLPCALLFFGVIKDDFKDLVLPSIRTNIIEHNPQCDVFLHTYNLTHVPYNPRTREFKPTKTDVTQAYELTSHVIIDTMENFDAQRGSILNHTRQHRHPGYHESETHDNIIKQWHSIEGAWDLMQEHEAEMLQQSDVSNDKHYYKRVGLFRSDTFFTDPIPIHDTNEVAAIANFAHWSGYNDRMFYGTYDNASVWAHRFNFTETYDSYKSGAGYHSETYLLRMLKHNGIKPAMKDVCIWRVRAGGKLKVDDCSPNGKGGEDDVIKNLEESGYEVVKKSKEFWETQRKESSDPSSTSST